MLTGAVGFALGVLATVALAALAFWALTRWWRRTTHRGAMRLHKRFGARIDRFKFADRRAIIAELLDDPSIAAAVRAHAAQQGVSEAETWARVRTYLGEIVPQFSLWFYYRVGLAVAEPLLRLFFRITVVDRGTAAVAALPRDAMVIYLMNHRSNADYVLAGYALAGQVAISYAVGEWARVFPLEYVFKTFGAYFIRRRFREPLYHAVLERYVQLITTHGVTQGIFPEGGLSRDGKFRPAKIGLLDYIIGVARNPAFEGRMYIIPVGINFDRVLEDRSLLRELHPDEGHRPPNLVVQFSIVLWYVVWNALRVITRRWRRYGEAAIVIGEPVPLAPWFGRLRAGGKDLFALSREARLGEVQALADDAMRRIGEVVPVPAVPLVCAAMQTLDADYLPRGRLLERVGELRELLLGDDRILVSPDEAPGELLDRAIELLRMRRAVARSPEGIVVLPRGKELVSYYANSIAHLLGDYAAAVKARDSLPVYAVVDL